MKDTVGGRIRARREALGWSQGMLADKMGTGRSLIGRYERDQVSPSVHQLVTIAKAMHIQAQALIPGIALVENAPAPPDHEFEQVPLAVGLPKRAWSEVIVAAPVHVPTALLSVQNLGHPVVVRGVGIDDMAPTILPTDSVLVDIGRDKPRWGELVIVRYEGKIMMRWFIRARRANWLEADNPEHKPIRIIMRDAELLGVVTTMVWRYPVRRDAIHGVSE